MKSQKEKSFSDFLSSNGELSSNRLVFLIGSAVIFIEFIIYPESIGIQNLVMSVMGFAAASTTVSKFANKRQRNDGENNETV